MGEDRTREIWSHPFLASLGDRHRSLLAGHGKWFKAAPGEILAVEGDPADRFILVVSGHLGLWQHVPGKGEIPIQTVGPSEAVGWSWIVPPHQWQFDCRAVDAVEGVAFDAEWLRAQCEADFELGYCLLKQLIVVIAHRLASTRLQLLDIYK